MTTNNIERNGFRWKRALYADHASPPLVRASVASGYQGQVAATYDVGLSPGDPVQRTTDGTVLLTPGTEGTPATIYGIVHDVKPFWDGTVMKFGSYLPHNITWGTNEQRRSWLAVIPVFGQLFEIDAMDVGSNDTVGEYIGLIENNADHILTAAAAQPASEPKLDLTSVGTDAEQWRIKDIPLSVEQRDYAGANVKVMVTCNEPQGEYASTTGT